MKILGQLTGAREANEEALTIRRDIADPGSSAISLFNIGELEALEGDLQKGSGDDRGGAGDQPEARCRPRRRLLPVPVGDIALLRVIPRSRGHALRNRGRCERSRARS